MKTKTLSIFIFSFLFFAAQTQVFAADLELTGWIPYWRVSGGTRDARNHIEELSEIHPFGYSVTEDGELKDLAKLKKSSWRKLFREADKEDVRIIPTVMWSSGPQIHKILSNPVSREDHIDEIVSVVKKGKFDGIDIDYEGKLAETKDYFSLFLKELKAELGNKMLTCAVEARTPPSSLYRTIPTNLQYANDYAAIGRYCDRVQIMTYDQGRADIKLNDLKAGAPYVPVADVDWVRKVVELTVQLVPGNKIVLGVATYGREYEVTVAPNWYKSYRTIRSLNPDDALDLADEYDVTPSRNRAGEMSFTYLPESSKLKFPKSLTIPTDTPKGNTIAAKALAYANQTGQTVTFNIVWWSDAKAIEDKVDLAKEFGLRGIAIFKIDGEEDRDIWDIFENE